MKRKFNKILKPLAVLCCMMCAILIVALTVSATELDTSNGLLSASNVAAGLTVNYTMTSTSWKGAEGNASYSATDTIVCTASSYFLNLGLVKYKDQATVTVTMTNSSTNNMKLSFAINTNTQVGDAGFVVTANSATVTPTNGTYECELAGGASCVVKLTSATPSSTTSGKTHKITISNIKMEMESARVTFYPADNGTYAVGGTPIASKNTIDYGKTTGITCTPPEGYKFVSWMYCDENGNSTHKIYTTVQQFSPTGAVAIKPVFAPADAATYQVGDYYYYCLDEAIEAAKTKAINQITVMGNGTLPAGTYTIPVGVTLLIPYDANNTLSLATPVTTETYSSPTRYRTLTMASGANIIVNGALSVSGKVSAHMPHNGFPTGALGFINMSQGSSITVNQGAKLYAWGYITGSGSVTIKSGATVYECFQAADYRGGDATSKMAGDGINEVFPMSQYYLQNVEVPMTMEAGSIENAFFAVDVTAVGIKTAMVPFIGPNAMFNVVSGALVKDYDEQTDRQIINVNGKVTTVPYSFNIQVSTVGSVTINSANYILPLNPNMTVNVQSGTLSISQDVALLPDSEINIAQGATCELKDGARLIVYDLDDWGTYCASDNQTHKVLAYAPGRLATAKRTELTKDASIKVAGTLDATDGYIYTTAGGANIYGNASGQIIIGAVGTETVTYQVTQYVKDELIGTSQQLQPVPIEITPAKLKNADDSYTQSTKGTYKYVNGVWTCQHVDDGNNICINCGNPLCKHSYESDSAKWASDYSSWMGYYSCTICQNSDITVTVGSDGITSNVILAPSCTTQGSVKYTAVVADPRVPPATIEETVTLEVLGHTVGEWTTEVSATCVNTGTKGYYTCSVCYKKLAADKKTVLEDLELPIVDHTMTLWSSNENTHISKCLYCTHTEGTAENHTWVDGTCSVCGYGCSHDDSEISDILATPADCENNAYYYAKCSKCGAVSSETKKEKADTNTGHTYADAVVQFSEDGKTYTVTVTCTVCPDTMANHTKSTEKDSSKFETFKGTCLQPSFVKYKAVAGAFEGCDYQQQTITIMGEVTDHSYGSWIPEDPATCEDRGTLGYFKCSVCDGVFDENYAPLDSLEIPALEHKDTDKDHLCDNEGCGKVMSFCSGGTATCKDKAVCEICGQPYGNPAEHTPGEVTVENQVAADCENDGSYDNVIYCTVCSTEISRTTETVTSPGHDWAAATCTTAKTCGTCGATEGEALGHKDEDLDLSCDRCTTKLDCKHPNVSDWVVVKPATCGEDGSEEKTCLVCKITIDTQNIQATNNHHYVEDENQRVPATCIAEGSKVMKCSECNDSYEDVLPIDPDNHARGDNASCTTAQVCIDCGAELEAAKGHSIDKTKAPCAIQTCSVCQQQVKLDPDAAHNYTPKWDVYHVWTECVCGEIETDSEQDRIYTIAFQGYKSGSNTDIVLDGTYAYGDEITVPTLTLGFESDFFTLEGKWVVDDNEIKPGTLLDWDKIVSLLLESAENHITIPGTYSIDVPDETIQMSVRYETDYGAENFLTLSLFVIINEELTVTLDAPEGITVSGGAVEGISGLYHYTLPLSATQMESEGAIVQIWFGDVGCKEVELSWLLYANKAPDFLDQDDELTGELLQATIDYGKAVQSAYLNPESKLSEDDKKAIIQRIENNKPTQRIEYSDYAIEESLPKNNIVAFDDAFAGFNSTSAIYGLAYTFKVNLPENAELIKAGIILADSGELTEDGYVLIAGDQRQKTSEKLQSGFGSFYGDFTDWTNDGVVVKRINIVNVPATELNVKYVTVYVQYTMDGEEYFAYSQTIEYGVSTYINNMIYEKVNQEGYENDEKILKELYLFDSVLKIANNVKNTSGISN